MSVPSAPPGVASWNPVAEPSEAAPWASQREPRWIHPRPRRIPILQPTGILHVASLTAPLVRLRQDRGKGIPDSRQIRELPGHLSINRQAISLIPKRPTVYNNWWLRYA